MTIRLQIKTRHGDRSVLVAAGEHTIGSGSGTDITVDEPTVSRRHASLRIASDGVLIRDLGSSNGLRAEEGHRLGIKLDPWPARTPVFLGEARIQWVPLADTDAEVAIPMADPPAPEMRDVATVHALAAERLVRNHLADLLATVRSGASLPNLARQVGEALMVSLPLVGVEFERRESLVFASGSASEHAFRSRGNDLLIVLHFRDEQLEANVRPLLRLVANLLALSSTPRPRPPQTSSGSLPPPRTLDAGVKRIYRQAERAARGGLNVLIHGETGTGKEVLARFMHAQLDSKRTPFIAMNCAALPEDLLEAELFGIEKGVATGVEARAGKFELADGGILFLDEIGDMPLGTQARILRVLQEGEVVRIGAHHPRQIRVQVIGATNQDIGAMVAAHQFRLDLYHRLNDWEVTLPPLRERLADIGNLAFHFLAEATRQLGLEVRGLSRGALDALLTYKWPGNVRELEREMKRLAAFADREQLIATADLSPRIGGGLPEAKGNTLKDQLAAEEKHIIATTLAHHEGNVSATAKALGMGRTTLYRHLKRLGIEAPCA